MRSPRQRLNLAAASAPAPVVPELIALNRMAFGPRPGDLDALMTLGATSEARLAAFVEQQLNPAAIDDGECDAPWRHRASRR